MRNLPRGIVLCSGSASSFRYLYENDPNYGTLYKIVGVFSDTLGTKGVQYAKDRRIPTAEIDFGQWCAQNHADKKDMRARKDYFQDVLDVIVEWRPDFVILSGFMLLITDPFYGVFEGRTLNVHPALLSILDERGRRKYRGINTVARAMEAGDPTGSTVHIINKKPDEGPIVAESPALPYQASDDPGAHQERMKLMCDGPTFQVALEKLIASHWPHSPWMG